MSSSPFLWADKPAGLTTHTSLNAADRRPWTDVNDGFMEWLAVRAGIALYPIHRLDRETTGVIAFARDRESAARAGAAFEGREVAKEYLFITDRAQVRDSDRVSPVGSDRGADSFEIASFIEREGNMFVSRRDREANAQTRFEKVQSAGKFTLWRARPLTGKPHQIRLHAEDAGIPLLGDTLHNGSEFPALCLHAHKITLENETHESPPPIYFTDLSLLSDPRLIRWLAACDRRERATRSISSLPRPHTAPDSAPWTVTASATDLNAASDSLRYIHTEGDPLRIEQIGAVTSLNWFRDTYPTDAEWVSIKKLLELKGWKTWYLQIRADRGKDPHTDRTLESDPPPPERWTARENGLTYEFRRETGLSPGLFLDQRQNRKWIQETSNGERMLNLFCYTGGFSVAAAKGGATQTVSIDVSKTFLEWAKRNFELNGLDPSQHEFRAIDSGEYLAWAAKKQLKFDTVICDPPSFARTNTRGKSKVFRIETEFAELLKACAQVATKRILFSTNFEQWSMDEFAERAKAILPGKKVTSAPSPDLDFELPRQPRHMKAIVIEL